MKSLHGKRRVEIERVYPEIDAGIYPIKRVKGEFGNQSSDGPL